MILMANKALNFADYPFDADPHRSVFDTPFESRAEEEFAYHLVKHIADDVRVAKQYAAQTELGQYRIDFVLHRTGRRLGIEIDGQPYHNRTKDKGRDALILAAAHVDEIVRIAARGVAF